MKTKKQGISLIVLVITIIVMIILAGSIILTLNNSGIINRANEAVDTSNLATIKTEVELKQAEYILENNKQDLETWLNEQVNYKGYYIKVYEGGAYIIKEGTLVDKYYKGQIEIGDYVDYNAGEGSITLNQYVGDEELNNMTAEQVTVSSTSSMKWRVLGAEGDKIKLISEQIVNPDDKAGFSLYGTYSYLKGVEILDNACSVFGKGKYAISARSITADDVNEITGFDKTKYATDIFKKVMGIPHVVGVLYGTKINYSGETNTIINGKSYMFPILSQPDITATDSFYVKNKVVTVNQTRI